MLLKSFVLGSLGKEKAQRISLFPGQSMNNKHSNKLAKPIETTWKIMIYKLLQTSYIESYYHMELIKLALILYQT
ncbi:hypothetical protein C8J95_102336 [Elizabethkingia sp. YR214]|nr:hypothetical protein C8J95_102336 [Elizabethkingia sp. YR214]